jgi:hypothetical protein
MRTAAVASRIKGRGAITRSLRLLLLRVGRYAQHRARTPQEQHWAGSLFHHLESALKEAIRDPLVRSDLARVETQARRSRKGKG